MRDSVDRHLDKWIVAITDVIPSVRMMRDLLRAGDEQAAAMLLPT